MHNHNALLELVKSSASILLEEDNPSPVQLVLYLNNNFSEISNTSLLFTNPLFPPLDMAEGTTSIQAMALDSAQNTELNLSFYENFVESIAQVLSKVLSDKETGKYCMAAGFIL